MLDTDILRPLWTQAEAIDLCREIEKGCPQFGCHVALTGGLLYKDGPRKDCDIVFYRIRQVPKIDMDNLLPWLESKEIFFEDGFGFVLKFSFKGKEIDAFFPEEQGTYGDDSDAPEIARQVGEDIP